MCECSDINRYRSIFGIFTLVPFLHGKLNNTHILKLLFIHLDLQYYSCTFLSSKPVVSAGFIELAAAAVVAAAADGRFGIPAFPYETNGMHKYFRRYSTECAEGGFFVATSACVKRASVPNYRVGFMNTIAATARKLAWRHWLLLPLMNLCICIPRRCSAQGTPQKKKKSRLLSSWFLTLYEASRLATPEG